MDLKLNAEELSFRRDVRGFIDGHLPRDLADKVQLGKRLTKEDHLRWHKILYRKGWIAPSWPEQFGGPGWSAIQQHLFDDECADANAPMTIPFGLKMVGPVIMAFGNADQQQYFLPRILSGEHWWCQGYSEPGAGSDLASLKTRAVQEGDRYILNGQKTWITYAQHADWMFCLARTLTGVRQQEGISFLLVDMHAPGVKVRPIIMLDGDHEINEVWFEDVSVPIAHRIGEENKGWSYAKFLLEHERTGIAGVGRSKAMLKNLKAIAGRETANSKPLIEDARFRDKIAQAELDLTALEITALRVASAEREKRRPGPEASLLKIKGTEIMQCLAELTVQAAGSHALPCIPEAADCEDVGEPIVPPFCATVTSHYFNLRKVTIFGGANEIQRNVVAKMILGL